MENFSILDQIIDKQKVEEAANLDAVEIINNLFNELSERERDIVMRRYGLHGNGKETLEKIGSAHNLTRERIRQIETSSISKLRKLKNLNEYLDNLKKVISQLLEEHGGIMEKIYLLDILVNYSTNGYRSAENNQEVHKNYLNFLITKLLFSEFEEINNLNYLKEAYKLKFKDVSHIKEIIKELLEKLNENKKIYTTNEIIKLINELENYKKYEHKMPGSGSLDISSIAKSDHFSEDADLINEKKALYSILRSSKKIGQNKFGFWGLAHSREVNPKTINDKIYLILNNHGKPLHFSKIADEINRIEFDSKLANAATVHNELILDKKYVLVGRGLYALKDWGYKKGTVLDVIEEIFSDENNFLTRDEIIEKVLEKRMVKKATIVLALMNKDKFLKKGSKYSLA
jgi:hypothetical protein